MGTKSFAVGRVVRDTKTGLEWMRCSLGQKWDGKNCSGKASNFTFNGAQKEARDFNRRGGLGGRADWRVPTVRELASLIDCGTGYKRESIDPGDGKPPIESCGGIYPRPAIQQRAFPNSQAFNWTSSGIENSGGAWLVDLGEGGVGDDDQAVRVHARLVRSSHQPDDAAGDLNDAIATAPTKVAADPASAKSGPNVEVSDAEHSGKPPAAEVNSKTAPDKTASRPSYCGSLANGDAVRVPIKGQPQLQSALV